MDVDAPSFRRDFNTFKDVIRELEHRLGALIVQVCVCVAGCDTVSRVWRVFPRAKRIVAHITHAYVCVHAPGLPAGV